MNTLKYVILRMAIAGVLLVFLIALHGDAKETRELGEKNERGGRIIEVDLSKLPPDLAKRLVDEMSEQKGNAYARHHEEEGDGEHADNDRHEARGHREHGEPGQIYRELLASNIRVDAILWY
jgi:hypothetical protein